MSVKDGKLKSPNDFAQYLKKEKLITPNTFVGHNERKVDVIGKNSTAPPKRLEEERTVEGERKKLLSPKTFAISSGNLSNLKKQNTKSVKLKDNSNNQKKCSTNETEKANVGEAISMLSSLRKDKLELENSLSKTQSLLTSLQKEKCQMEDKFLKTKLELERTNKILEESQMNLQEENKEKLSLKLKCESMEKQHFSEMKKLYANFFETHTGVEKEKNLFENKIEKLSKDFEVKLSSKTNEIEEQDLIIKNLNEQMICLNDQIRSKNVNMQELKETIVNINEDNEQLKISRNEIYRKFKESLDSMSVLKEELSKQMSALSEKESIIKLKDNELSINKELYDKNILNLQGKIDELTLQNKKEIERSKNYQLLFEELSCKHKPNTDETLQTNHETAKELSKANDIIAHLQAEILKKKNLIGELNDTCSTLESSNKLLNIRYDALVEIEKLQKQNFDTSKENKQEQLQILWRKKVFQMLVLSKTHELECKK